MVRSIAQPSWFGQPRGLTVLFLTNMWEQFSYYGMRTLLVYYMTKQLLLGQASSSFVYGAYTACAYFTPIIGGAVADRLLGKRKAIIIGGSLMALGHFMMTFEPTFYVALATIAVGNGLFLPSLPSQIDDLYRPGDPRVGWAYNIYYVGINIGGFLAPLICGTLGEVYGWHYGFGAAGIGMLAGLCIYVWGQRHLPPETRGPRPKPLPLSGPKFGRDTMMLLCAVALAVTVFRGAYEQIGNTVALWADTGVDRRAGSFVIPMTWFQSLNPLMVMAFTPVLLAWWNRRATSGAVTSPVQKMAYGAMITGCAYLLLAGLQWTNAGGRTAWPWFALFFAVYTLGELFVLPTGLGLFARLAPSGFGATTVAAWFLATFTGNIAAGLVGASWSAMPHTTYFIMLAAMAGMAGILLGLIRPLEARALSEWKSRDKFL